MPLCGQPSCWSVYGRVPARSWVFSMDPAPVAWPDVLQPCRAQRKPNVANVTDVCLDTRRFSALGGCRVPKGCYLCSNLPVEIQYSWVSAISEILSPASCLIGVVPLHGMQGVRSSSLLGSISQIDCNARGFEKSTTSFLLSHPYLRLD